MARALAIVEGVFGRACLLDKNRRVGTHAHPEPHVILKIAGADFEYEVGSAVAPCTRERVVLVNALQPHGNRVLGKASSEILALYLSPRWLVDHHPSLLAGGPLFRSASRPVAPRLRELADRAAAEMQQPALVKESRLQYLFSEIAFAVFELSARPADAGQRLDKRNDFRIRRAVALMREAVDQRFELAELAARVGLSRSRFFELFAACTGLPPKHYLDMLRMDAAIAALARSQASIAEVAQACGYSAQGHFTRFFVSQIGITPGEYRRAAGALA